MICDSLLHFLKRNDSCWLKTYLKYTRNLLFWKIPYSIIHVLPIKPGGGGDGKREMAWPDVTYCPACPEMTAWCLPDLGPHCLPCPLACPPACPGPCKNWQSEPFSLKHSNIQISFCPWNDFYFDFLLEEDNFDVINIYLPSERILIKYLQVSAGGG